MAGPWPPITPDIPTGNVDNDADSLTLARIDIKNLIDRFNLVLASIDEDDIPLTNNNSGGLMPVVNPSTDGQVPVLVGGSDGTLARSGYPITISDSLPDGNLARTQAIKAYIAAQGAPTPAYPVCVCAATQDNAGPAGGFNVAATSGVSNSVYTIDFVTPLNTDVYYPQITVNTSGLSAVYWPSIIIRNTNSFQYEILTEAGARTTSHQNATITIFEILP